jgi:hypothetical protein
MNAEEKKAPALNSVQILLQNPFDERNVYHDNFIARALIKLITVKVAEQMKSAQSTRRD